jgi:trans-aconitate methyltransferase
VSLPAPLIEAVSRRFLSGGRFAYHYARAKLRHDAIYRTLLQEGLIPNRAHVLDLGCGQGILLALLAGAGQFYPPRERPPEWPFVPRGLVLEGVDVRGRAVRLAEEALGAHASVMQADLRTIDYPESEVIVLLDVLHYLPYPDQEQLLGRLAQALHVQGTLLLRVADWKSSAIAALNQLGDRFGALLRGEVWGHHYPRSAAEWSALLERSGFNPRPLPLPGVHVLLVAQRA